MNQKEILTVKNLTVNINNEIILKDLSFSVKESDVLIILGPNGAGKTTLLRTLLGLIPYEGKIEWKTQKFSYLPPQELLARKGLPPLSIQDFFKFKNVSQQKIINILIAVGLDSSILKKQFNALSTGQFQRMIIAWSLVDEPSVLLFDEPTSGIDIGGEETIYSLLHKFWKEKKLTILLITHDLNIVWEHASKVLCLNKKQLCMGKPNEVLSPENLKKLYETNIKFYKHEHGND
ncbi:ATP-binding cassette domain-containing protein [Candidatus Babeliales bacterium]|nr:ATP-binding cassette domain-containing protein [Candidatus Babeliales bacterium]